MIKNLKNNLSILFMISVLSIFTVVFCLFIDKSIKLYKEYDLYFFERLTTYLIYQLENTENYYEALTIYENDENMVFKLKNADNALLYQSNTLSSYAFENLIDTFENELKKEATYPLPLPNTYNDQSGTFLFKIKRRAYYGIQAKIITNSGTFYNLYCLKEAKSSFVIFKEHIKFYVGTWFLVFLSFLILTKFLIQKAMNPTEIALQSQKEFIAAVSHELKSPLAVILSSAEYISCSGKLSDEIRKQTDVIDGECFRLSKLIQDLLLLSSVDANTWSLNKTEINVDTLLINIYEKFEPICRKKKLLFQLKIPEQLFPSLLADETRLNQILSILIDNAIHYSPKDSKIKLGVALSKNSIVFTVVDHGTGIKEEDKPFIYDRFFCADESRTLPEHYGLGLSIAKELIEMHKGNILLKDTLAGGCTFIVSIPLS